MKMRQRRINDLRVFSGELGQNGGRSLRRRLHTSGEGFPSWSVAVA
jgi:hypothetical protein